MPIGVPSTNQIIGVAAEAIQQKSKGYMAGSIPGLYYCQYGASAAITNAGPSSLFNASATTSVGSLTFPAGFFNRDNGYSLSAGAPTLAQAGTRIRVTGFGTLLCTATPNLTLAVKFTNGAGTAQALATTAATALVAITNATTATTSSCKLMVDMIVPAYATGAATGQIITRGEFQYSATPLLGTAPLSIYIPGGTVETSVASYDMSQALLFDIVATVSATTATLTMNNFIIEVLN